MTDLTNITVIEDKVVELLEAKGVDAYAYESPSLDQVPLATLSLTPPFTRIVFGQVNDGWGITRVTWTLRYYVDLSEGADDAQTNMKTGLVAIVNALGADVRLGNKCRSSELGEGSVEIVATNNRPELMFEAPFTAVLHPNIGA